jgi:hypothetical protein
MLSKATLAVLCVSGIVAVSCRAQEPFPVQEPPAAPPAPQRVFGAEEALERAAELPAEVLLALGANERVETCIAEGQGQQIRKEWFGASRIDLNSDDRLDLVIPSTAVCLARTLCRSGCFITLKPGMCLS